MKKSNALLLLLGILFISFNLRAPITAVGSVVDMIQQEYALSNAVAGFITTLPLVAFAIVSPFVAKISAKIGHSKTMLLGLVLILLGEIFRSYTGVIGLFAGTAVIGVGIAIGNVIIPAIIKMNFSEKAGFVTSIYTSGMCIFAAVGAGISIPLAKGLGAGWKHTLFVWFILTAVTILIWLPQTGKKAAQPESQAEHHEVSVWRESLAWWVTLFMGTQSLLFYSLVAWLPTIVASKGLSPAFAGNMALLFQLMAIPATLVIPTLCDRFSHQRGLVYAVAVIYGTGMTLFLLGHSEVIVTIAVVLMSIGMGGSISLSIAFISLRSHDSKIASELSGMSQSAGYLFAGLGPILTGFLFDTLSTWTVPVGIFIALIVFLCLCGHFAGAGMIKGTPATAASALIEMEEGLVYEVHHLEEEFVHEMHHLEDEAVHEIHEIEEHLHLRKKS